MSTLTAEVVVTNKTDRHVEVRYFWKGKDEWGHVRFDVARLEPSSTGVFGGTNEIMDGLLRIYGNEGRLNIITTAQEPRAEVEIRPEGMVRVK